MKISVWPAAYVWALAQSPFIIAAIRPTSALAPVAGMQPGGIVGNELDRAVSLSLQRGV